MCQRWREWNKDLTLKEGLLLSAKILIQTTDAASPKADMTEFAILTLENGRPRYRFLSDEEVSALLKEAADSQTIVVDS